MLSAESGRMRHSDRLRSIQPQFDKSSLLLDLKFRPVFFQKKVELFSKSSYDRA
jgi:hypothetical protein